MKRTAALWSVLLLAACITQVALAQSLEERLRAFGDDFAKGYTQPVVDAFGAGANSGWFNTANVDDGISLFVGVKAMIMPIPDDGKKFRIKSVYDGTEQQVPTFFGDETETHISGAPVGASPSKYPKGANLGLAPLLVPHISVGNIFGTRAMVRYFPATEISKEVGKIELLGFGVQHSVSQHIPLVPVDIAVLVAYQNLKVGDLLDADALTIGAQVSKSLPIITVYGGIAYESSKMKFGYNANFTDPQNPAQTITKRIGFDAEGKNNFRLSGGVSLSLLIINISADYSLASQPVATLGVGIGI